VRSNCSFKLGADRCLFPSPLTEELDGLDKDNILDNETGVQTRGVESDAYAKEREVDEAVDAAVGADEGQKQ
jgi:hypothetical protein